MLVFSQSLYILQKYAKILKRDCIYGKITNEDRDRKFEQFRTDESYSVLFISSVQTFD